MASLFNTSGSFMTYVNNSSVNTTNSSASWLCFSEGSFIKVLAYVVILLVSLVGNSMTVAVVLRGRLHGKNVHLFLVNMAIADLVVTVVYMPRMVVMMLYGNSWLVTGRVGLILCRTVPFLHHMSILVCVFTILGATLDRFFAMVFPLRTIMTKTVGKAVVVAIWLGSAIIRCPYVLTPKLKNIQSKIFCSSNLQQLFGKHMKLYEYFLLGLYCFSLFLVVLLYSVTILKVGRRRRLFSNTAKARRELASKKLLNMLIVILVCFVLCWFLYFFALIILPRPLSCLTMFLRFFLAHSNSALNPCILAVFNRCYRRGYRKFMKLLTPCFKNTDKLVIASKNNTLSAWNTYGFQMRST